MNPFLKVEEFPNFPAMTPAAAEEALPKLLADAKAVVDKLEKSATPESSASCTIFSRMRLRTGVSAGVFFASS